MFTKRKKQGKVLMKELEDNPEEFEEDVQLQKKNHRVDRQGLFSVDSEHQGNGGYETNEAYQPSIKELAGDVWLNADEYAKQTGMNFNDQREDKEELAARNFLVSLNQVKPADESLPRSNHFTITTDPQVAEDQTRYLRYQPIEPMDHEIGNPEVEEARIEDELERLKNKKVDELEESLLMPQELYNRHVDESFRLRKLEQSLDAISQQKKSSIN